MANRIMLNETSYHGATYGIHRQSAEKKGHHTSDKDT